MPGPFNIRLRLRQRGRQNAILPVLLGAQQRKFQPGYVHTAHRVTSFLRTVGIRIGQHVAQVGIDRVRVALY